MLSTLSKKRRLEAGATGGVIGLGRLGLGAEVEQGQEEEPEAVHEVPVIRGDFRGDFKGQASLLEITKQHVGQSENATDQMRGVGCGEDVEEAARWI